MVCGLRRPPISTVFPYTTLFRSALAVYAHPDDPEISAGGTLARWAEAGASVWVLITTRGEKGTRDPAAQRSEEHTSELQSRENLVCRLLLEKKNINADTYRMNVN